MNEMNFGIKICFNDWQNENAFDSIRLNDDGDSNEIDESDSQREKQREGRISTELGIKMCFNDFQHENAFDSIRRNDDGDSNEIDESDLQFEKQLEPRISICLGIVTRDCDDDSRHRIN